MGWKLMALEIGIAKAVQGQMTAVDSDGSRQLSPGSPVFKGDVVSTAKASAGSIQFLDKTILNVGEGSKVSLDQYVFDANKGTGQVLFKMAQGTFRAVTGEIVKHNPEAFKLQSPLAIIGIRGTETAHTIPLPGVGEGKENHLVMVFDGKPVIVQPLGGGAFQVLSQSGVKVEVGKFGAGPMLVMTPQEFKYYQALTATGIQQGAPTDTISTSQSSGSSSVIRDTQAAASKAAAESASKAAAEVAAKAAADAASKAAADATKSGNAAAKAAADAAAKVAADAATKASVEAKAAAELAAKAATEASAAIQAQDMVVAAKAAAEIAANTLSGQTVQNPTITLTTGMTITIANSSDHFSVGTGNVVTTSAVMVTGNGSTINSDTGSNNASSQLASGSSVQLILSPSATVTMTETMTATASTAITTTTAGIVSIPTVLDFSASTESVHVDLGTGSYYYGSSSTSTTLINPSIVSVIGSSHDDTLIGNAASNTFMGGAGNDTITGGSGNDTVTGGAGNNNLDGGGGLNTISYASDTSGVIVSLATGTAHDGLGGNDTLVHFSNIIGSTHADSLTGNADANIIEGYGGGDTLSGGTGGADTVSYEHLDAGVTVTLTAMNGSASYTLGGTAYTDTLTHFSNIIGTHHADMIVGDMYSNVIEGMGVRSAVVGSGDTLSGGIGGTDTVSYEHLDTGVSVGLVSMSGSASYILDSTTHLDTLTHFSNIIGTHYADMIVGDMYSNVIEGGGGGDVLSGGIGGTDTVSYEHLDTGVSVALDGMNGSASYTVNGTAYTDTLAHFSNIIGSAYADHLTGDSNDNLIEGLGVNSTTATDHDILSGGTGGTDTVSYEHLNATAGVTVSLTAGDGIATYTLGGATHTDTLTHFSNIIGSAYADHLTGDSNDNVIEGGLGNDFLFGGLNTVAVGDTVSYEHAGAGVTVSLLTGTATSGADTDTISGFENIFGSAYADTLTGDGNNNVIEGGLGINNLTGGAGTDTVSYEHAGAGVTVSLLTGIATGVGIADTLFGFENITGSAYADKLTGNSSANVIFGHGGADTLTGGIGSDTFLYKSQSDFSSGQTITDFSSGADKIAFNSDSYGGNFGFITSILSGGAQAYVYSNLTEYNGAGASNTTHPCWYLEGNQLKYDQDGHGTGYTAQVVTTLTGVSSIAHTDVVIVDAAHAVV